METLRVAAILMRSELGKPDVNIARMESLVRQASERGVQIVCFPEACISGYGVHPAVRAHAEPIPGPLTEKVLRMASESGMTILAGLIERDDKDSLYLTHFVASPSGILGTYRKVHLGPPEKEVFRPGSKIPVFRERGVTFGIELCYEAHFPELSTHLALKGAEVLFIPHASPHETPKEKMERWLRYLPARAYDNSVFVVACNQTGENGAGLTFPGVAMVLDPKGRVLASQCGERETMGVATLHGHEIHRVRSNPMAYFLQHRRPEVYEMKRDA